MRLKKILSVVLAAAMVATMAVVPTTKASASDAHQVGEKIDLTTCVREEDKVYFDEAVQAKPMSLDGEVVSDYCVGLKPKSVADKDNAKVSFTVNADKAGTYEIALVYAAKGTNRPVAVKVNDGEVQDVSLPDTGDHQVCDIKKISVHLNKGENVITFSAVASYDNSTVKTPNIVSAKLTLKEADPETPAATVYNVGDKIDLTTCVREEDKVYFDGAVQAKTMTLDGEVISDYCVGLKPKSVADKENAKVSFTVNADKAGTYNIELVYAASGSNRPIGVKVNDGEIQDVALPDTTGHQTCDIKKISVHLNKGENVITFSAVPSYDNSAVKTPNIVSAKLVLTQEDSAPAQDPSQNPSQDPAQNPSQNPAQNPAQNPSTGVASLVFPVAAIMLLAGFLAIRALKKEN